MILMAILILFLFALMFSLGVAYGMEENND